MYPSCLHKNECPIFLLQQALQENKMRSEGSPVQRGIRPTLLCSIVQCSSALEVCSINGDRQRKELFHHPRGAAHRQMQRCPALLVRHTRQSTCASHPWSLRAGLHQSSVFWQGLVKEFWGPYCSVCMLSLAGAHEQSFPLVQNDTITWLMSQALCCKMMRTHSHSRTSSNENINGFLAIALQGHHKRGPSLIIHVLQECTSLQQICCHQMRLKA